MEANDSNTYQCIPPPKDGTLICGDESSCRNGDQGHSERPGAGRDKIVYDSMFESFSFFRHNAISIKESQPSGKAIKKPEGLTFDREKR
jgi:hypothetical protein